MITYQDYLAVAEKDKMEFVREIITQHKSSDTYKQATIAKLYDSKRNKTIEDFQKFLYTFTGQKVPDLYSANYKLKTLFFNRFVTGEVQHSLSNGITWQSDKDVVEQKLGKDFDIQIKKAARKSIVGGDSFVFFNLDHVEVFEATEFAPLMDEENGSLRAGVRFWQIDANKPLRATLYEEDGYTEYIWRDGEGETLHEKRSYKQIVVSSEIDGTEIMDGENYPSFPIVPMYANEYKQSELVGIREKIDCYDLIESGYANNVDEASLIYWTFQNTGGMDDIDIKKFIERIKTVRAADVEDGEAVLHTADAPYESREALLNRLKEELYADFGALDVDKISSGNVTATQIKAAYDPVDNKADDFEYCLIECIQNILELAGIKDNPTFERSYIINKQEDISNIVAAAAYLPEDYVTRKILTILGDGDHADEILNQMAADEFDRMNGSEGEKEEEPENGGNNPLEKSLEE